MSDFNQSSAGSASKIIISIAVLILAVAVGYALIYVSTDGEFMTGASSSSSSSSAATMQQNTTSEAMDDTQNEEMTATEKAEYDGCVNAANAAHNQRWADACEDAAINMQRAYAACVERGGTETSCKASFDYEAMQGDDCNLPTARDNALNVQLRAAVALCAK